MRPHRDKEWYEIQLRAGRDMKHIADYLLVPKTEVVEDLKFYGIYKTPEPPAKKKPLGFDDAIVNDTVTRDGITYTIIERTEDSITIKPWNKMLSQKTVTKAEWKEDNYYIKAGQRNIKRYNLNDTPDGRKELERIRKQCINTEEIPKGEVIL